MVFSNFIKFLLGKQSFYKVFSNDFYDRLKYHVFAWLSLDPDPDPDSDESLLYFSKKLKICF